MRVLLAEQGFQLVEGDWRSNFVMRNPGGLEIDVHTVRFDEEGNGIYRMLNGEDWVYPAAGFAGRGRIGDREVRCLTPEVQMLCHDSDYEPDEDDFRQVPALLLLASVQDAPGSRWNPPPRAVPVAVASLTGSRAEARQRSHGFPCLARRRIGHGPVSRHDTSDTIFDAT